MYSGAPSEEAQKTALSLIDAMTECVGVTLRRRSEPDNYVIVERERFHDRVKYEDYPIVRRASEVITVQSTASTELAVANNGPAMPASFEEALYRLHYLCVAINQLVRDEVMAGIDVSAPFSDLKTTPRTLIVDRNGDRPKALDFLIPEKYIDVFSRALSENVEAIRTSVLQRTKAKLARDVATNGVAGQFMQQLVQLAGNQITSIVDVSEYSHRVSVSAHLADHVGKVIKLIHMINALQPEDDQIHLHPHVKPEEQYLSIGLSVGAQAILEKLQVHGPALVAIMDQWDSIQPDSAPGMRTVDRAAKFIS